MQEIIIEIKIITDYYVKGEHCQAYESLYRLCCDNKDCNEFSDSSMAILAQFNELEKDIANMRLDFTQQHIRKKELFNAFKTLIGQMNRRFNPNHSYNKYDEQIKRMKEQHDMLFKSKIAVEQDLSDSENQNPNKIEALEYIIKQLNQAMAFFKHLIKKFQAVKQYD